MEQLKIFIELTRLKKPIGYMLLFWPCTWGLTLAYDFKGEKTIYIFYIILFLLGSILMRSAGCIVNDLVDKNFDKKVHRTRNRPIASGRVSTLKAISYTIFLCMLALSVLIQFNIYTIFLALFSMPLAFIYPLMKRYTYWPQLFLGVTFNYGILLGWSAIYQSINVAPLILYVGSIFWTLGYDTIYGFQDIKDDEIIGLKSTSIKFKSTPYIFLKFSYAVFIISLLMVGFTNNLDLIYYFCLIIVVILFYNQVMKLNFKNSTSCLLAFKANNAIGFVVLISLILGKL